MEYGCIGERLPHSFSKEVHERIADYHYELKELTRDALKPFMQQKAFQGINVTIPYKEAVIPYLDYVDPAASAVGAVNTVVKRGDQLFGYNTDVYGMRRMIERAGIEVCNKKVLILGTGGTSKTAAAVMKELGASSIIKVSRNAKADAVSYEDAYLHHSDTLVLINTTPLGMYPDIFVTPVDMDRFPQLEAVIDVVYNPLQTEFVTQAKEKGLRAVNGLYMLVAQAVKASEIFTDSVLPAGTEERVFRDILSLKQNIILTGMPGCGKSTVGKILAEKLGRLFIDTDDIIRETAKMEISDIFTSFGEPYFRDLESRVIRDVSLRSGCVIATGGGAVLREENVRALKMNGKCYFIDREPELLIPTVDRPLALSREAICSRYNERYSVYLKTADVKVDGSGTPDEIVSEIERRHYQ